MRAYLIASLDSLDPALESRPDAMMLDVAGADPAALAGLSNAPFVWDARGVALWVRLSGVETPAFPAELAAVMPAAPTAIAVPVRHGRDVAHVGARLAVHEAELGLADRSTRIVALIAGAAGVLDAASLVGASRRLAALGWDAGALSAELGTERSRGSDAWAPPLAQARGHVRLAAAAAGIEAIEAACPESGETAFRSHIAAARRDGFGAVFVTDPMQVTLFRQ